MHLPARCFAAAASALGINKHLREENCVLFLLYGVPSYVMSRRPALPDLWPADHSAMRLRHPPKEIQCTSTSRLPIDSNSLSLPWQSYHHHHNRQAFPVDRELFENLRPRPPDPIAAAALGSAHHAAPVCQKLIVGRLRLLLP